MTNYGEARKILKLELKEWEEVLSQQFEDRHAWEEAFKVSRYDSIIEQVRTIRGLRRALRALEVTSYCQCPNDIKPGQTSVMCCNICGAPDEAFWKPEKIWLRKSPKK